MGVNAAVELMDDAGGVSLRCGATAAAYRGITGGEQRAEADGSFQGRQIWVSRAIRSRTARPIGFVLTSMCAPVLRRESQSRSFS